MPIHTAAPVTSRLTVTRFKFVNRLIVIFRLMDRALQLLVSPRQNRLSFISSPDYSDNAYFVYRHSVKTRIGLEHVWLLDDLSQARRIKDDFEVMAGSARGHSLRLVRRNTLAGYWLFLTSRYVFFTHGIYRFVRWAFRRSFICLWHGMPIKCIGHLNHITPNPFPTFGTHHVATSHFFRYVIAAAFRAPPENVILSGLPRCDALRTDYSAFYAPDKIRQKLGITDWDQFILWMPTYRTEARGATEFRSFLDDIPSASLDAMDRACAANGCVVLIKLHPYDLLNQIDLKFEYRNLRFLKSAEWIATGIPLYELIAASAALISDVSSILIDYMVTQRPIGVLGFNAKTYTRDLVFPVELLLASQRIDQIKDATAIEAFIKKTKSGTCVSDGVVQIFHREFEQPSSEAVLSAVGLKIYSPIQNYPKSTSTEYFS